MHELDMRVPQGTASETTKEENGCPWSRGTQASPVTASFPPLSLNSHFSRISDLFIYFPVTYQQTNGSDPSAGYGQSSPSATQCFRCSIQVRFAPPPDSKDLADSGSVRTEPREHYLPHLPDHFISRVRVTFREVPRPSSLKTQVLNVQRRPLLDGDIQRSFGVAG